MSPDLHADRDRLEDDLAAYSLGALGEDERTELEAHLAGCPACRERLHWLSPAVDVLPAGVEQLTPPTHLRENLMAIVTAEAAATETPAARAGAPARGPASGQGFWRRLLAGAALRPATGMAVLIVLVAGVAAGYLLRGSGDADTQFFAALPTSGSVEASATLERHGESATLHVAELPALDRDEVYQVWLDRAGVLESASTFVLEADGSAKAVVPGPLEGGVAVLVTKEPRPGSRQPTTPPLLEAPLS